MEFLGCCLLNADKATTCFGKLALFFFPTGQDLHQWWPGPKNTRGWVGALRRVVPAHGSPPTLRGRGGFRSWLGPIQPNTLTMTVFGHRLLRLWVCAVARTEPSRGRGDVPSPIGGVSEPPSRACPASPTFGFAATPPILMPPADLSALRSPAPARWLRPRRGGGSCAPWPGFPRDGEPDVQSNLV